MSAACMYAVSWCFPFQSFTLLFCVWFVCLFACVLARTRFSTNAPTKRRQRHPRSQKEVVPGGLMRLHKNLNKRLLPRIFLAIVRSLDTKMDQLRLQFGTCKLLGCSLIIQLLAAILDVPYPPTNMWWTQVWLQDNRIHRGTRTLHAAHMQVEQSETYIRPLFVYFTTPYVHTNWCGNQKVSG